VELCKRSPVTTKATNFIVLGSGGNFTFNVLRTLIEKDYRPQCYIQWQQKMPVSEVGIAGIPLQVRKPPNTLEGYLAEKNITLEMKTTNFSEQIKSSNTDFILVACWPILIPQSVIDTASKAALNLHPSMLPEYRGIDPISEQLKQKNKEFGISLHLLDKTYDNGDIVLQQKIKPENNADKKQIETLAAIKGAELFMQAVKIYHNPGWNLVSQKNINCEMDSEKH